MASVKQYGYYYKGNKICIVEKDAAFDNDANSRDYGPDAEKIQWRSPLSDVSAGLEIEYTHPFNYYIPGARIIGWDINANNNEQVTALYSPCYGENEGYLAFYFPANAIATGCVYLSFLYPS